MCMSKWKPKHRTLKAGTRTKRQAFHNSQKCPEIQKNKVWRGRSTKVTGLWIHVGTREPMRMGHTVRTEGQKENAGRKNTICVLGVDKAILCFLSFWKDSSPQHVCICHYRPKSFLMLLRFQSHQKIQTMQHNLHTPVVHGVLSDIYWRT